MLFYLFYGANSVVQIICLSTAGKLFLDSFCNNFLVSFCNSGLYRQPAFGRRLNGAYFFERRERHVQGAGDWGGRKRQDIQRASHFFEFFLLFYAKPLLVVENKQTQVFKFNVV